MVKILAIAMLCFMIILLFAVVSCGLLMLLLDTLSAIREKLEEFRE